jgi:hypothetical protein
MNTENGLASTSASPSKHTSNVLLSSLLCGLILILEEVVLVQVQILLALSIVVQIPTLTTFSARHMSSIESSCQIDVRGVCWVRHLVDPVNAFVCLREQVSDGILGLVHAARPIDRSSRSRMVPLASVVLVLIHSSSKGVVSVTNEVVG